MVRRSYFDTILGLAVLITLLLATFFLTNTEYRIFFGLLFGMLGVVVYFLLFEPYGHDFAGKLRLERVIRFDWTLIIHLAAGASWLLVPSTTELFYADWSQLPPTIVLRGALTFVYGLLIPGSALVKLLDSKRQLTRLEVLTLGSLFSFFLLILTGYVIFTIGLSLSSLTFPIIWIFATLTLVAGKITHGRLMWSSQTIRPSSFSSRSVAALFLLVVVLFVSGILGITASWHTTIGGDLWTHIAQAAYYIEGYNSISYPWGYHFLIVALWAISGLPVVNVAQLLQSLTVLPILAMFVSVSAYVGRKSKVPVVATLFYAIFMGLGWISYLYLRSSGTPSNPAALYNLEYLASAFMYDITHGVFNFRVVFLPETLAITALILGMRLLRGFTMTPVMILLSSMVVTFTAMTSHVFEAAFFVIMLVIAALFRADMDYFRTIFSCELGAAFGLVLLYAVDSLSPLPQRIFTQSSGYLYYSGLLYSIYAVTAALSISLARFILIRRSIKKLDPLDWVYSKLEKTLSRIETSFIRALLVLTFILGIIFGLYTVLSPPFYAWSVITTAEVPWNYYPIRLGLITFFAIMGGGIIILHRETVREYWEFLSLAAVALTAARLLNLFGPRPLGFGESRVMDILWIGVTPLAGYGFVELARRFLENVGPSEKRKKMVGAVLILVVILAGASSYLILVDAKITLGQVPGYAATPGDMQVLGYIVAHRDLLAGAVTAPTYLTQYKIRALALTYPVGYFDQNGVLPIFRSSLITDVLASSLSLLSLRVFVSSYDIFSLSENGFSAALWYLAFQPVVVDARTSYLVSAVPLGQPSPSASVVVNLNQQGIGDFFTASSLALSNRPYSVAVGNNPLPADRSYLILSSDPADTNLYDSTLSWVQTAGRTLIVVSNQNGPGLYESQLFGFRNTGTTFSAVQITGNSSGMSSRISLPSPLVVRSMVTSSGTVVANFVGGGFNSPLASVISHGSGHVVFLSLRDYYLTLSQSMFDDLGRTFYHFLPQIFLFSGLPLNP